MKTILFDIDGTLADLNGREEFLKQEPPDWKNFNAKMEEDIPNTPVVELYRTLYESRKFEIILVSGRQERFRKATETWLLGMKSLSKPYSCVLIMTNARTAR